MHHDRERASGQVPGIVLTRRAPAAWPPPASCRGYVDDPIQICSHRIEGGIGEALAQSPGEFLARKLDVALAFADIRHHRLSCPIVRVSHGYVRLRSMDW